MRTAEIAAAVGAQAGWMRELLVELVRAPTTLGNEEPGQVLMERAFRECGLDPFDVALDAEALRRHPNSSPFSWEVEGKRNVCATWAAEGDGGHSLILNGHVDVVPAAEPGLWSAEPFAARGDGDWVIGRGAGDMKAGLVAMTGAVRALREAGVRLRGEVHLQSVVEEECTGNGTLQCLIDGPRADACVITEPHPDHMTVAQMGVLWFHVDVVGEPAHAARAASLGRNAIDCAYEILAELRLLEGELNADPPAPYRDHPHPANLNPGRISGGDWPSTVAASCTLSCRLGFYPGEDPAAVRSRVEAAVTRVARRDPFLQRRPPTVRYDGFSCEGCTVAAEEPLVGELAAAFEAVHGRPPQLQATTATTDARHFVREGIPAVCFGPRGEGIHEIDERVSVSSMVETAEVLAGLIVRWCGT